MIIGILASVTTALILGLGTWGIVVIAGLRGTIQYQRESYKELEADTKQIENERNHALAELKSIRGVINAIQEKPLIAMLNERQAAELNQTILTYLEANRVNKLAN